jgi:hypothetical protein
MMCPLRIEYPGAVYHITNRGNKKNRSGGGEIRQGHAGKKGNANKIDLPPPSHLGIGKKLNF